MTIVNLITDYILEKKLKPGDQLPTEPELMTALGVGRNSVREGIKMLVTQGVVEIRKGIGSFVADRIPPSALNPLVISLMFEQGLSLNLVELRVMIDTGIGDLVIDKAIEEDFSSLVRINEQIKILATSGSAVEVEMKQLDQQFHTKMIDNPLVARVAHTIYKLFFTAMGDSMVADPLRAYENHLMVLDSINKKDRLLLRESVKNSLVVWSQYINEKN
jgi:DNA-binding FadR family transcriptional regulator